MRYWKDLTNEERRRAIRAYIAHEGRARIANRYQIAPDHRETFYRKLRDGSYYAGLMGDDRGPEPESGPEIEAAPYGIDADKLAAFMRNTPRSLSALSREFDRSEYTVAQAVHRLKDNGYNVIESRGTVILDTKEVARPIVPKTLIDLPGMRLKVAVASDIHAASTAQQVTALRRFIREAYEVHGIKDVFVPGDVTAGMGVYRGQIHDLYAHSADAQRRAANATLPRYAGLRYYMIGGNHDYSHIKSDGYNIVQHLCQERDDCVYLGYDMANVSLTDRCDIRLWHPSGGVPYALSYRLQKGQEQFNAAEIMAAITEDRTPNLRLVFSGHLHVQMSMMQGAIQGLQAGCFEGQTNYLKRKGLYPQIGGWILELRLTDAGLIQGVTYDWLQFSEIVNDWRNYPELVPGDEEPGRIEALYEWRAEEAA